MKSTKAIAIFTTAVLLSSNAAPALSQQPATESTESVYVYYFDELTSDTSPLPLGLRQLRSQNPIFAPCAAAQPEVAPWLVPLILFGVKLFGSVAERHLSDRETRRVASLSRTYAQVRAEDSFPLSAGGPSFRCLVVDRVSVSEGVFSPGAIYVMGLRRVGNSAFTIEPIAARIDSSSIIDRARPNRLNATLSLSLQSVVANSSGNNEQMTLPAYSVTFGDLVLGDVKRPPSRRSSVMPIVRATGTPTSVAVAVTESHVALERVKQQIALEQANRAALLAAIGETVKTALTD